MPEEKGKLRKTGLLLLWLGCFFVGLSIGLFHGYWGIGVLGGAGAGFFLVALFILFRRK